MAQSGSHFEEFASHTRLKHAILRIYLFSWAFKLLQSKGADNQRVFFVDAFAGRGRDEKGNKGSPAIAAQVALEVNSHFAKRGRPEQRMEVIAIEKDYRFFQALSKYMSGFDIADKVYHLFPGRLVQHLDAIKRITGRAPTLWFLDPFGIKGLDASTYGPMLSGPKNELFVLFSDSGAVRHHGLITADPKKGTIHLENARNSPLLFEDLQAEDEDRLSKAAQAYREHLDLNQPKARETLNQALGSDDWEPALATVPRDQRPQAFLDYFKKRLLWTVPSSL